MRIRFEDKRQGVLISMSQRLSRGAYSGEEDSKTKIIIEIR